jgi:hypothetical protein
MSRYSVTSVNLQPLEHVHDGTGLQTHSWKVCEPHSVEQDVKTQLEFIPIKGAITALAFDLDGHVVPRRFAVAVRADATAATFTRANIFFHPNPAHAHMKDSDYPDRGLWPRLFRYMQNLGTPLAAAGNSVALVMPYMTAATANSVGILADDWEGVVNAVLGAAKAKLLPHEPAGVDVQAIVVSSFCFGIRYSDSFRRHAARSLKGKLKGVWDFDGLYGTERSCTAALHASIGCEVFKYDQAPSSDRQGFHVPLSRWSKIPPPPPKNTDEVHQLIPSNLFFHACKKSSLQ